MKRDFTLKQLLLSLGGILLLVTSVILYIVYMQKKQFYAYVQEKYGTGVFYNKEINRKDYFATSDRISGQYSGFGYGDSIEWRKSSTGHFFGTGFTLMIYEVFSVEPLQIVQRAKYAKQINYVKRPMKKEGYYEPGHWEGNNPLFSYYVPGEYKERLVEDDFPSPHVAYQSCWNTLKKELDAIHGKEMEEHVHIPFDLMFKYRYWNLRDIGGDNEKKWYSNEYFNVQIEHFWTTYKIYFSWITMFQDIVLYFLLTALFPFFIYLWVKVRTNKCLFIWLLANYVILLFSADKNNFFHINTYKTVWPFNDDIVMKREDTVFLGTDPETGLLMTQGSGKTYINGIRPVAGYDFSEFVVYCALGYLLLRKRKDENSNPDENDKDENEANIE